MLKSEQEERKL
ncbi:ribosomal protein N-acetylase [Streptococcus lutetiensis 033]|uniref:Ribosomal protein N-acetylase n=1 Tax=Streptococcus lutetiensis 033 TaxID=1076934 RepID=A0AB33AKQ0_9STRE|nr:ribosomal protein N-acetylase [Streptococcus lutetiensis 033]